MIINRDVNVFGNLLIRLYALDNEVPPLRAIQRVDIADTGKSALKVSIIPICRSTASFAGVSRQRD